jgi:peptide/nickel transport system permease protein
MAFSLDDSPHSERRPSVILPAAILLLIFAACFLAPTLWSLPPPVGGNVMESNSRVLSQQHLLGTDLNGNDVLSRVIHGGKASMQIALAVNLIGLLVGATLGVLAAWIGGFFDSLIMRAMDLLIAFPSVILVLAIAQTAGPGMINTIIALSALSIPACARIARVATLRLKRRPYITAAILAGCTSTRILCRHITPNVAPQLLSFALLGTGIAMTLEGALSFLGLGVPLPEPSWGNMIRQGQEALLIRPELMLIPSALLVVTVISLNWLGAALRYRLSQRF